MTTANKPALRAVSGPSADSDEALLERVWAGDDAALAALLHRYRNFVRAKARPFFLAGGDREDVVQEGMIGLYKAIRDYQPDRLASFRAFAELCITRQIITAVKTATRQKHAPLNSYVSLHQSSHDDHQDHETVVDLAATDSDPLQSVITSAEMDSIRRHLSGLLSDLEAEVLQRYIAGESYEEMAAVLDRQVKAIDNALQRTKRKVETYLLTRKLDQAV